MSEPNRTATIEQTAEHPNAATIRGLREVADWLELHPELPKPYYAAISLRASHKHTEAREELNALALALGDRATEKLGYGGSDVEIEAKFGDIRVSGAAAINDLLDEPVPTPEYRPIIERREQTDDVLDVYA